MTHRAQQVNPQPTPPAASLTVHGQDVTVHDLFTTTGRFQTFTHNVDIRVAGRTIGRYEVIEARGHLTCARTAGKWSTPEACYGDLAEHAVRFEQAMSAPSILKRLSASEWICVLPGACLTGTLDGQTLTIRDGEDVLAVHAIQIRKNTRTRYQVPGVGAWADSLSAIRDLIRAAALPYLSQGVAA